MVFLIQGILPVFPYLTVFFYFMASNSLLFCLENNKARSNDFAEKNGLQKYEYVLHPRTTGFTFVVDRLREGKC